MKWVTKKSLVLLVVVLFPTARASTFDSFQQNLRDGQQLLQSGQIYRARDILQQAYQQVARNSSKAARKQQASVMATLGETYIHAQQFTQAAKWLSKSYQLAQMVSEPRLLSAVCHRLGLLYAMQNKPKQALQWYIQALTHAEQSLNPELIASSYINLSKYQAIPTVQSLTKAYLLAQKLKDERIKCKLLLAIGYQAQEVREISLANQALRQVLKLNPNTRQQAQALGYLGRLYRQQGREDEALLLTQQAIMVDHSSDLLIQWEQQQAELLKIKSEDQRAIQAYRRAVMHIENIRQDIPIIYQNGQSSFKTILSPIYVGLVDLLLQQNNSELNEKNINEVQAIWEYFKSAELNDYFRSTCNNNQTHLKEWQASNSQVAILYPIILPDRLELLLSVNQTLSHYRVEVTAEVLSGSVNKLLTSIKNFRPLSGSQQLYQWLITPILDKLKANHIDTLIYIPDGILRKVPLSVLNNGDQYLIEQYAVVTNPGLSMLSIEQKSTKNNNRILLAGMSKLGPVIDELPESNKNWGSLPKVEKELNLLSSLFKSSIMLNEQFTLGNFERSVLKGQSIIHIASHGYFSENPDQSFLMTYDHLLTMNDLASLFKTEAFTDSPVELMSLSACQTAEGNDRSPLGLSGVVVQAGVRSAIGTLWPVQDEAAQKIFVNFYQNYQQGMSKAQALQQAQVALIRRQGLEFPVFWSGFVLIGDWR